MLTDPICALATPPGRSALALIRLSGIGAFDVARVVLGLGPLDPLPASRQSTIAMFRDRRGPIDRGLVVVFPGPASYSGEDMVEFSCHGGVLVPAQLLAALVAAGARPAHPGEFTRRALANGKLDLIQAEGVADLIDATAPVQGRAALAQLEGGLSKRIERLRADLLDSLALLSYDIDFPEEDDGPVDRTQVVEAIERTRSSVDRLLTTAPIGTRLRTGALVVIAGRPNAGKSSLLNALLGVERALVTEIPGTTRDAVEASAVIDGWPVRLADTAGIRDSEDRIERMGVEVSRRYLEGADLVLLCVEGVREPDDEERAILDQYPSVLVRTKSDLTPVLAELAVSVVTGDGLADLRLALAGRLFADERCHGDLEPLVTQERHQRALEQAASTLDEALDELNRTGDAVLAAHHVQRTVAALNELVGAVDVEEVLGRVFARFCVGK